MTGIPPRIDSLFTSTQLERLLHKHIPGYQPSRLAMHCIDASIVTQPDQDDIEAMAYTAALLDDQKISVTDFGTARLIKLTQDIQNGTLINFTLEGDGQVLHNFMFYGHGAHHPAEVLLPFIAPGPEQRLGLFNLLLLDNAITTVLREVAPPREVVLDAVAAFTHGIIAGGDDDVTPETDVPAPAVYRVLRSICEAEGWDDIIDLYDAVHDVWTIRTCLPAPHMEMLAGDYGHMALRTLQHMLQMPQESHDEPIDFQHADLLAAFKDTARKDIHAAGDYLARLGEDDTAEALQMPARQRPPALRRMLRRMTQADRALFDPNAPLPDFMEPLHLTTELYRMVTRHPLVLERFNPEYREQIQQNGPQQLLIDIDPVNYQMTLSVMFAERALRAIRLLAPHIWQQAGARLDYIDAMLAAPPPRNDPHGRRTHSTNHLN